MKSKYIMEEEQYAYSFIKRWSAFIIIMELVLGVIIGVLYQFDHKEEDIDIVKRFIMNEYEICYPYRDELITMCEQCDSISELVKSYNSNRLDLELGIQDRKIDSMELAVDVYKQLLPAEVNATNEYLRPWVYTWALSDVRANVNKELDDYYQIQYNLLLELRLHEPYLLNNTIGKLYYNIDTIVTWIVITEVLLLALGAAIILYYYYTYIRICRRNRSGRV